LHLHAENVLGKVGLFRLYFIIDTEPQLFAEMSSKTPVANPEYYESDLMPTAADGSWYGSDKIAGLSNNSQQWLHNYIELIE
jgi:hypothetical protein